MENITGSNGEISGFVLAIYLSETCVIVVLNLLALCVFLTKTFCIKKSNFLLLNLTVTDLLVGLSLGAKTLNEIFKPSEYDLLARIFDFFSTLSVNVSICSFTAMAMERSYAIVVPMRHRLLGNKTYAIGIVLIWVAAIFVEIIKYLLYRRIVVIIKMLLGASFLVVVFVCYLAIWIKVKFAKPLPNRSRTNRNNIKLTITLFIVTLMSTSCFLPSIVLILVSDYYDFTVQLLPFVLVYANSFINFLIYSVRMPEFRKELCKVLRKCLSPSQVLSCSLRSTSSSSKEGIPIISPHSERRGKPSLIIKSQEGFYSYLQRE
ncbi:neuropeptide FF receptor 2 [Nematostella vectensis]|uniref:neuropeptide FF receptor 2 n=1 Tax=Nematostella vectensis TaxID=45351 RepID=UPI0020770A80|nr:neuropeptide FF receptor 2 [Nematostella vectensis]